MRLYTLTYASVIGDLYLHGVKINRPRDAASSSASSSLLPLGPQAGSAHGFRNGDLVGGRMRLYTLTYANVCYRLARKPDRLTASAMATW